jgi:hypothetical protein
MSILCETNRFFQDTNYLFVKFFLPGYQDGEQATKCRSLRPPTKVPVFKAKSDYFGFSAWELFRGKSRKVPGKSSVFLIESAARIRRKLHI